MPAPAMPRVLKDVCPLIPISAYSTLVCKTTQVSEHSCMLLWSLSPSFHLVCAAVAGFTPIRADPAMLPDTAYATFARMKLLNMARNFMTSVESGCLNTVVRIMKVHPPTS
jgi:hypothetical protein